MSIIMQLSTCPLLLLIIGNYFFNQLHLWSSEEVKCKCCTRQQSVTQYLCHLENADKNYEAIFMLVTLCFLVHMLFCTLQSCLPTPASQPRKKHILQQQMVSQKNMDILFCPHGNPTCNIDGDTTQYEQGCSLQGLIFLDMWGRKSGAISLGYTRGEIRLLLNHSKIKVLSRLYLQAEIYKEQPYSVCNAACVL